MRCLPSRPDSVDRSLPSRNRSTALTRPSLFVATISKEHGPPSAAGSRELAAIAKESESTISPRSLLPCKGCIITIGCRALATCRDDFKHHEPFTQPLESPGTPVESPERHTEYALFFLNTPLLGRARDRAAESVGEASGMVSRALRFRW